MKVNKHSIIYDKNLKSFAHEHVGETFKVHKVTENFVDLVQQVELSEAEMHMEYLQSLLECTAILKEEEKAAIEYAIECIKTLDDMGILKGEQNND